MKLSNLEIYRKTPGNSALDTKYYALVDVTRGIWPFRTTRTVEIQRLEFHSWYFAETGDYTPGFQAEALERAFWAKHSTAEGGTQ